MQNSLAPWLSVIIPIYNAEKYLRKCLNSVKAQMFTDFEVLLIDDGSTDKSADICKEFSEKDKRFRYFKKENGGAYQTRIYGAEKSVGEYITFCDSDDYYATEKAFEIIYNEITTHNCSALQFCYYKKFNHLKTKCPKIKKSISVTETDFFAHEYPYLLASSWKASHLVANVFNKIYHRKYLKNLPSSDSAERVFWGDDLILNLHLLSTCDSFRFIDKTLYCYREFSGGTNKFSLRAMQDMNIGKNYQTYYLNKREYNNKAEILGIMFAETAAWLFNYIKSAVSRLKSDEVLSLVSESLTLPSVVRARDYYINVSAEQWDAVNLLRRANPEEYVKAAETYSEKRSLKKSIVKLLKRIYKSL